MKAQGQKDACLQSHSKALYFLPMVRMLGKTSVGQQSQITLTSFAAKQLCCKRVSSSTQPSHLIQALPSLAAAPPDQVQLCGLAWQQQFSNKHVPSCFEAILSRVPILPQSDVTFIGRLLNPVSDKAIRRGVGFVFFKLLIIFLQHQD